MLPCGPAQKISCRETDGLQYRLSHVFLLFMYLFFSSNPKSPLTHLTSTGNIHLGSYALT